MRTDVRRVDLQLRSLGKSMQFDSLVHTLSQPCFICRDHTRPSDWTYRNIGTLDWRRDLVEDNVIPLCFLCAKTRRGRDKYDYIVYMSTVHLYTTNRHLGGRAYDISRDATGYMCRELCKAEECDFSRVKFRSNSICSDAPIDRDIYSHLCKLSCYYCGESPANGVDRIDSDGCYTTGNMRPCCYACNRSKHDLGSEEFLGHAKRIAELLDTVRITIP